MSTVLSTPLWNHLDYQTVPRSTTVKLCGLIELSSDITIAREVRDYLTPYGVELHTNRIEFLSFAREDMENLKNDIPEAVEIILPGEALDVVAIGCASGAIAIGPEYLGRIVNEARPDVAVTDPVTACLAAFASLDVKKTGILTPYPDSMNTLIADFFQSRGVSIGSCGSFKCEDGDEIARIDPESIVKAGLSLVENDTDCLLISCTALRSAAVIGRLQQEAGIPVFSSNQALAWHILRLAGKDTPCISEMAQ